MQSAAVAEQWLGVKDVTLGERRLTGQRAAILGLRLLPDATAPLGQLAAFDLYRRLGTATERAEIEAEIARRRNLDPAPGSTGYWQAFKDAYALIRGLEAAEAAVARADHDFAYSFSDGERNRFDGSYAEFKAARLDRCVEAHEQLAQLRDFARAFPMVAKLLAAKASEQHWRRQAI